MTAWNTSTQTTPFSLELMAMLARRELMTMPKDVDIMVIERPATEVIAVMEKEGVRRAKSDGLFHALDFAALEIVEEDGVTFIGPREEIAKSRSRFGSLTAAWRHRK